MTLTISVPDELVERLERRAADHGQSAQAYASRVVVASVGRPPLEELLAPVREDFAQSGEGDDEITGFLRAELDAHRQERKAERT